MWYKFALGSGLGAPYVLECLDYGLLSGFSKSVLAAANDVEVGWE